MFSLEIVGSVRPLVLPKVAMVDFDGTITCIREGWQAMLLSYFAELIHKTPAGKIRSAEELDKILRRGIEENIGKKPIFQCIMLTALIRELGGTPLSPEEYETECERRLDIGVLPRIKDLHNGGDPQKYMIPGTLDLLNLLKKHNLKLYLVSGTEDNILKSDAAMLGLKNYFDGGMFGSLPDTAAFSKAMIVEKIVRENGISGEELLGIGDGRTETIDVKAIGGFTIGVASDEKNKTGVDPWKREQLLRAGADWIIPDYTDITQIETALFAL